MSKVTPFTKAKRASRGGEEGFAPPPPYPPDEDPRPPFIALGVTADRQFVFLDTSGRRISYRARELSPLGLLELCGGDPSYLIAIAPPGKQGLFDGQAAAATVMGLCFAEGLVEVDSPIRGPGVWPSPTGALVVHAGDAVWVDGDWRPAGFKLGPALYTAAPPKERPALQPLDAAEAAKLERGFLLWSWKHPEASAALLAGVYALAMLGAAPRMRAHLVLTGDFEVGKSALQAVLIEGLGPLVHETTDISPAGMVGRLNHHATVIIYDEAEGQTRAAEVLDTMRSMTGRRGVRGTRGTAEGGARSFTLHGTIILGAIHPPDLKPEDRSRIVELDMLALPLDARGERVDALTAWARRHGSALRARMIERWDIFGAALERFSTALRELGCSHRMRDLYGHCLAARWCLGNDLEPDEMQARQGVLDIGPILNLAINEQSDGDGFLCLAHLITSTLDDWRSGQKPTIGKLILEAFDAGNGFDADRALRMNGIRVDRENQVILIATHHRALAKIYHGTRWEGRGYVKALANRLQGSEMVGTIRYVGFASRAVSVQRARLEQGAGPPEEDAAAELSGPVPDTS